MRMVAGHATLTGTVRSSWSCVVLLLCLTIGYSNESEDQTRGQIVEPSHGQDPTRGQIIDPSHGQDQTRGHVVEPSHGQDRSREQLSEPSHGQVNHQQNYQNNPQHPNVPPAGWHAPPPLHPPPPPPPHDGRIPSGHIFHEDHGHFDPDDRLEVLHEFKIPIGPASEECFFQKLKKNAHLHFSFQVLSGSDKNIDVVIRSPDGQVVQNHLWSNKGKSELLIGAPGVYGICLGNLMSRFSAKLVHFFLLTFVMDEWHRFTDDLEKFDTGVLNSTTSLMNVQSLISHMHTHQALSRQTASADWYIIMAKHLAVQNWSIVMSAVIMLCSLFQVLFVRRLFRVTKVTPTAKPRA